jgi:transcription elongation factor Elf1
MTITDTAFTCLFCHHDKSVTVRLDRKEGVAQLVCRVCDQRYQSKVNRALFNLPHYHFFLISCYFHVSDLTEPIDIYSEWIDAADAAQREEQTPRRPAASSSRPVPAPASVDSDDE